MFCLLVIVHDKPMFIMVKCYLSNALMIYKFGTQGSIILALAFLIV